MRRHLATLTGITCLALASCAGPGPNPASTPVQVTTSGVDSAAPSTSAPMPSTPSSTASITPSRTTEPSQTQTDESSPAGSPSISPSTSSGDVARDVDLAEEKFPITPQAAIDTARGKAGNGTVHSIELDWSQKHGAWVYELEILVGDMDHDVDVHAETGEVLSHEQDDTNEPEFPIDLEAPMTWQEARDRALDAQSGRITGWKLEADDGRVAYEFDILSPELGDVEVEVNVETGAVTVDD